jgi:hypothetical protein
MNVEASFVARKRTNPKRAKACAVATMVRV